MLSGMRRMAVRTLTATRFRQHPHLRALSSSPGCASPHRSRDLLFRVLRPDQDPSLSILSPAPAKAVGSPKARGGERNGIEDHIMSAGPSSRTGFISFTSELNCAISFGGCLSPIVHVQKQLCNPVELDRAYMRQGVLADKIAHSRAMRSDEVLVEDEVIGHKLLDIGIERCNITFSPTRVSEDATYFPCANEIMRAMKEKKNFSRIGSANDMFFYIGIAGKRWIVHPSRPNISLEYRSMLFGDQLVSLARHEFACFSAYRYLVPERIPRCVLCEFDLVYQNPADDKRQQTRWPLIVMEDLEFGQNDAGHVLEDEIAAASWELLPADLICGNWNCAGDEIPEDYEQMVTESATLYAWTRCDKPRLVRILVDRALGCTYPEDLSKKKKHHLPFDSNPHSLLRQLTRTHKSLYGDIQDKVLRKILFGAKLHRPETLEGLLEELNRLRIQWPDLGCEAIAYQSNRDTELAHVVRERFEEMVAKLPYREIDSAKALIGRDGHAACPLGKRQMVVLGGNSESCALKDCWLFDFAQKPWTLERLPEMPLPLHSFSAATFEDKYIIVFGGTKDDMKPSDKMFVLDVEKGRWHEIKSKAGKSKATWPRAVCRHSGVLYARKFIISGGWNGKCKSKDVWVGHLRVIKDPKQNQCPLDVTWDKMPDLLIARHRHACFIADGGDTLVVVAGFGADLKKLECVPLTAPSEKGATDYHTVMLRAEEEAGCLTWIDPKPAAEGKSLAGFAYFYDTLSKSLIMIGGDTIDPQSLCEGTSRGSGRLGYRSSDRYCRILELARKDVQNLRFGWRDFGDHGERNEHSVPSIEELSLEHRLVNYTSMSACLLGDKNEVILFGGRGSDHSDSGKVFSNRIFSLSLRPENDRLSKEIDDDLQRVADKLQRMSPAAKERKLQEVMGEVKKMRALVTTKS